MTCTIESLRTTTATDWAWFNLIWREPDVSGNTDMTGSATCAHPEHGSFHATLNATGIYVHSHCSLTSGSAEIDGQHPTR